MKNNGKLENNSTDDFRSQTKKQHLGEPLDTEWRERKRGRMQCSTPVSQYRVTNNESPNIPPVTYNHGDNSPLLVDSSIYENESGEGIDYNGMRKRKINQLDILEMTLASDESTDTHARKVAETVEVVERGLFDLFYTFILIYLGISYLVSYFSLFSLASFLKKLYQFFLFHPFLFCFIPK